MKLQIATAQYKWTSMSRSSIIIVCIHVRVHMYVKYNVYDDLKVFFSKEALNVNIKTALQNSWYTSVFFNKLISAYLVGS